MDYTTLIRRELHMHPEVGFDLDNTLAVVRRELDATGIEYTEEYGRGSIVATINPEKRHFTIGIRADMDALSIKEQSDAPYRSQTEGKMHACGHDAHTAIALTAARRLYEMRESIACRVRIVFQPAEEYTTSGARVMSEAGVMDGIDLMVALHVDPKVEVGKATIREGEMNATSDGFSLNFYGKSAHAANQQNGVDAIAMAVKAYTDITFMTAKGVAATEPVVFNVGKFNGGTSNNIISEQASMFCTLRTWSDATAESFLERIRRVCSSVAECSGGRFEFVTHKHLPVVYNDPDVARRLRKSAESVLGEESVSIRERDMIGEDFSYFARRKPSAMIMLGVRNEERGIVYGLHDARFDIDESALALGADIFVRFVLDNMNA